MALNKYMHQRNIYRVPPDFGTLAKLHAEFSSISKVDVTGKVTIDFKDANALRVLTKCLLKTDFNLDVVIPEDRLVPTLPLRLNYILWLEDLLISIKRNDDIKGLDIGTGACAIYPLLAAVKNKWNMLGTETDPESFVKAEENVQRNNLQGLVKLKKNASKSIISHVFADDKSVFDFCMCNPPFYSNLQELCDSRSPARLPPKNGFTGSPQELITEGGELEFCRKLIRESKEYKDSILIFTTMVGHKYNLNVLIQDLKSENITHTHTEFCQGRVTRWGLAWTFKEYDIYELVPPRDKPRKKPAPTIYLLPELPNCTYNVETAFTKIKELLNSLNISHKLIDKRGNTVTLDIIAHSNTWSNQRRKRRQQKRVETEAKKRKQDPGEDKIDNNDKDELDVSLKTNTSGSESELPHEITDGEAGTTDSTNNPPIVHAFFKLLKNENDVLLEMEFIKGSAGKEGLHQIVQFIKNNWK
ncbi:U6 small nuclear RNA (adenine-(43)-N(6))-methyltransferase isoform X2 [Anticarsia gemmatalis]